MIMFGLLRGKQGMILISISIIWEFGWLKNILEKTFNKNAKPTQLRHSNEFKCTWKCFILLEHIEGRRLPDNQERET